jgi:prolyl oligopeptidase
VRRGGRKLYFAVKLPIDPKPYHVEQVWYESKDGTRVSMFLVRPQALQRNGKNPVLLYGYGGFNVSLTPRFRASWFVWLEQGGTVAIPNLRGGGEYGEAWHRAGMGAHKQNTFDDFLAAARWLIKKDYTRPQRLAIRGGSNGGLLVGAAMVQAPRLFGAVACHVPLLDMVRYHRFGSGKTWIGEYGSAEDPAQFQTLYAYSPYHHVQKGTRYPALIMMAADSDDRVDPMHARKFTAAVRWATTSGEPVLFRVEEKAGHGGGDMVKKRVASTTDELTFLLHQLGVTPR